MSELEKEIETHLEMLMPIELQQAIGCDISPCEGGHKRDMSQRVMRIIGRCVQLAQALASAKAKIEVLETDKIERYQIICQLRNQLASKDAEIAGWKSDYKALMSRDDAKYQEIQRLKSDLAKAREQFKDMLVFDEPPMPTEWEIMRRQMQNHIVDSNKKEKQ